MFTNITLDIICDEYKESLKYYNDFLYYKKNNLTEDAQKSLNAAGPRLYSAVEYALKYYLKIEPGKKTTIKSCVDLVVKHNNPLDNANALTEKRLRILHKNGYKVANGKKHNGENVDITSYVEMQEVLKDFILQYIDASAPIYLPQESLYKKLQQEVDDWNFEVYNFCLICDKFSLSSNELCHLNKIKWSLVIDFDIYTSENGLLAAFKDLYNCEPNHVDLYEADKTEFDTMSLLPYWYHINGLSDTADTLVSNAFDWNIKYKRYLNDFFKEYAKKYTKPLVVIIMGGTSTRVKEIVDAIYYTFPLPTVYIIYNEEQYQDIRDTYDDRVKFIHVEPKEFIYGIRNYSARLTNEVITNNCCVYGNNEKKEIDIKQFSHFEIPYINIANDETGIACEAVSFYQGKSELSWFGSHNGFAIKPIKAYNYISDEISKAYSRKKSVIISLNHAPGAGGTTLARIIAYKFSESHPVIILKQYKEPTTRIQLQNFYQIVGEQILIIAEKSSINDDTFSKMKNNLKADAIPFIILRPQRIGEISSDNDLTIMTMNEYNEMKERLRSYVSEKALQNIANTDDERYPFFVSMYAFDENFHGVKKYIEHYFTSIKDVDKEQLGFLALVDKYANQESDSYLDISILGKRKFENVFIEKTLLNLIRKKDLTNKLGIRIKHTSFSNEILEQIMSDSNTNNSNIVKGEKLSTLVRKFIAKTKDANLFVNSEYSLHILTTMLINNREDDKKFTPLIEDIKTYIENDNPDKYIGIIFKDLVDAYPDEPHFLAHLSRYYTNIEKDYPNGIKLAQKAVELSEKQGKNDYVLYHICGNNIYKYVKCLAENFTTPNELAESNILELLTNASKYFALARKHYKSGAKREHAYFSDIKMCIWVVDKIKKLYKCSTEDFVRKHRNSWAMEYYERAIMLHDEYQFIEPEQNNYYVKEINATINELSGKIESTMTMWEEYLASAAEHEKAHIRRLLAKGYERKYLCEQTANDDYNYKIMKLMEENINQDSTNNANIMIWVNAFRRIKNNDSELMLEEAKHKLSLWRNNGSVQACYFYFVIHCIMAIEGKSSYESQIKRLQEELKTKSKDLPYNRKMFDYLGKGYMLSRLISNKAQYSWEDLQELSGRIDDVGFKQAYLISHGMRVFFNPHQQEWIPQPSDKGKEVVFRLAFSYGGPRALNNSVVLKEKYSKIISTNNTEKLELFRVIGPTKNGCSLRLKMNNNPHIIGLLSKNKLEKGKNINDYKNGELLTCKIIGKRNFDVTTYDVEIYEDVTYNKLYKKTPQSTKNNATHLENTQKNITQETNTSPKIEDKLPLKDSNKTNILNENKLDVIQKLIPLKTSTESHYEDDLLKLNTKSSITITNCEIINNSQIKGSIVVDSNVYVAESYGNLSPNIIKNAKRNYAKKGFLRVKTEKIYLNSGKYMFTL